MIPRTAFRTPQAPHHTRTLAGRRDPHRVRGHRPAAEPADRHPAAADGADRRRGPARRADTGPDHAVRHHHRRTDRDQRPPARHRRPDAARRAITSPAPAGQGRVTAADRGRCSSLVALTVLGLLTAILLTAQDASWLIPAAWLPTHALRSGLPIITMALVGLGIGELVRNQTIAVAGPLVVSTVVTPMVTALAPDVSWYLPAGLDAVLQHGRHQRTVRSHDGSNAAGRPTPPRSSRRDPRDGTARHRLMVRRATTRSRRAS
jgi:hypothetical protein